MIGNSTKFNKIGDKKRRKPPIHLTTYRGWEYSWLRRWINVSASGRNAFSFHPVIIEPNRQRIPAIQNVIDAASIFFILSPFHFSFFFVRPESGHKLSM